LAGFFDAGQRHRVVPHQNSIMARYDWKQILSIATLALTAGAVCVLLLLL
jgi:hypothetical protein